MADARRDDPVTAVVPVKPLVRAKSRMLVDDDERADLALAFALDVVAALHDSPLVGLVLVVTSDDEVAAALSAAGAVHVPDDATDLRASVQLGIDAARAQRPSSGVAVVPADLPCLTGESVTAVIASAASTSGAFVPDREGSGTTLLVLAPGHPAVTRYGVGSAVQHAELGLRPLPDAPPGARHDVDTLDDLRTAVALGVGERTREAMALRDLDHDLAPSAS